MRPVRIKLYSLIWMTRRTYLWLQFFAFLFAIALMVIGFSAMLRTRVYFPHVPAMDVQDDLIYQFLLLLFWLGLLIVICESIEALVVLRKFARAEAARKAELAAVESGAPAPIAPSSTAGQTPPEQRPTPNIQP